MKTIHVLSYSGGKDSTAMYLMAIRMQNRIAARGGRLVVVFADTGNEHPLTYEYVRALPALTGGPAITWVKADLAADIERKRGVVQTKWRAEGISEDKIARALAVLQPTGNPYLDLCIWKGRFPSRRAQFCTEELKVWPVWEQVVQPLIDAGNRVVSWQGVRQDESRARANLPRWEYRGGKYWIWRPIYKWTAAQCIDFHRANAIEPNPLYKLGMGRVGCMPCINCRKDELREIAARFPEVIDRIAEWEALVSEASKPGASTFFAAANLGDGITAAEAVEQANIRRMVEWSRTSRGGKAMDLFKSELADEVLPACSSVYGLCE